MKAGYRLPNVIFYLLTALMVFLTIYCFIRALPWINRPFAGIMVYDFPHVGSMGSTD